MQGKPTVIIVAGPTAVGKTGVALELAQRLHTEIISADSRQCYTGMTIGTAQPTIAEQELVPHHFVNCFPPDHSLSAADFEHLALGYLQEIFRNNQYAVVCGGTGLYIKALCEGLDDMPAIDPQIEEQVNREYALKGRDWLRAAVAKEDPGFYAQGETDNPSRMIRALVFHLSHGKSISAFRTGAKKERPFRVLKIGLELPRDLLYERINTRVDQMMQDGLLNEVQQLYPLRHLKNLNTVGYSELFDFIDDKISLAEAVEKIKQHSRNYAKRQLTWFKKDDAFHWFQTNDTGLFSKIDNLLA